MPILIVSLPHRVQKRTLLQYKKKLQSSVWLRRNRVRKFSRCNCWISNKWRRYDWKDYNETVNQVAFIVTNRNNSIRYNRLVRLSTMLVVCAVCLYLIWSWFLLFLLCLFYFLIWFCLDLLLFGLHLFYFFISFFILKFSTSYWPLLRVFIVAAGVGGHLHDYWNSFYFVLFVIAIFLLLYV